MCGESTGASAGGLWPGHECLALASPSIAPRAHDLHVALRAEFDCDFVRSGVLVLLDDREAEQGRERVRQTRRLGFEADLLAAGDLAACEPALDHAGVAIRFAQDGSIHPLKLAAGIVGWLRRKQVRICLNQDVLRIEREAGTVLIGGERVSASSVVVAAGAWTPLLTRVLGWQPPIRPIRGTLLATGSQPHGTLRSVVIGRRYYYWQLACGPLAGGGSEEDVGFRPGVCDAVATDIRRQWVDLFPSLGGLRFTSRWSGFRPFCGDMNPVIGRVPGTDSVFVSAGHFRRGILLAPLSGELLADELVSSRRWSEARAFRPERFVPSVQPSR